MNHVCAAPSCQAPLLHSTGIDVLNLIQTATGWKSLRQRAAERLVAGTPAARQRPTQSEALTVLYQLASSPATALDAMTLLYELQVHQVEVDLQQEELLRSQSELQQALARQSALVERAPVAYMTIDARGMVCQINLAVLCPALLNSQTQIGRNQLVNKRDESKTKSL